MKRKPRMVDLFCKAGGASMGYHLAGFEVVGVDIEPQPRYPFEFHKADAMTFPLDGFDVVVGSPPCRDHTALTSRAGLDGSGWLLAAIRQRLDAVGVPLYVLENVPGAPIRRDLVLCGEMFGLRTVRHRWFEVSGLRIERPEHVPHTARTSTKRRRACWDAGMHVSVTGDVGTYVGRQAMGIEWMTGNELSQAIPPAYTEWIGVRLLAHLADTGGHGVANLRDHPRDGSCTHWHPLWGYCRSPLTRPYLIGPRCRLDAPGATGEHCAHRVPWGQECQACLDIWSTEGTVKA